MSAAAVEHPPTPPHGTTQDYAETTANAAAQSSRVSKATKEARLFIGQISYEATEDDLRRLFGAYGQVLDVHILQDKNQSKGAAFITMGTVQEADTAIAALHDKYRMLSSRFLQVSYAKNSPNISSFGLGMAKQVHSKNTSNPLPDAFNPPGSVKNGRPFQHPNHGSNAFVPFGVDANGMPIDQSVYAQRGYPGGYTYPQQPAYGHYGRPQQQPHYAGPHGDTRGVGGVAGGWGQHQQYDPEMQYQLSAAARPYHPS